MAPSLHHVGGMAAGVLVIDGSFGEGGGQILRTAVGLAAITGRPIRIEKIRAGRAKPGLGAQHLTAVRAVAAVCDAQLSGDFLGSRTSSSSLAAARDPPPTRLTLPRRARAAAPGRRHWCCKRCCRRCCGRTGTQP